MKHSSLYLLGALALLIASASQTFADIPPSPEQKKKIAETPRIMPKGEVATLSERPFARTVGGGKAKVIIPKAVFDELAAAVSAKAGGSPAPTTKEGAAIPPIALVFAGLALSGACFYLLAKAPRYRTIAATSAVILAAASLLFWTRQTSANAGPPRPRPGEGQIIIEVPSEGTEVVVYIPESKAAESKAPESEAKPK